MDKLTVKQIEALTYIIHYIHENGFSPSIRELQEGMGYKSTSTAHFLCKQLEEKGYVERKDNSPRALRVVKLYTLGVSA